MAVDRGLPPVPQGLSRSLTVYLQNLHAYMARLGGLSRGSTESEAVRRSETTAFTRTVVQVDDFAVTTGKIRDGAVTEQKLANGAVTSFKIGAAAVTANHLAANSISSTSLANGSVTARTVGAQAIGTDALQDGSVTSAKLAEGLLPSMETGEAEDGGIVTIPGTWREKPSVWVAGFSLPVTVAGTVRVGVENIAFDGTNWTFNAVVFCEPETPDPMEDPLTGTMQWVAFGYKGSANVEP